MSPPASPSSPAPRDPRQPLSGIRILDLTRLLPGPWSTMLLADLGAEVIKIENPETGGDPARSAQPRYTAGGGGESVYFCNVNRNKRSIVLDLKAAGDLATFRRLARDADVVVENFRAGAAAKLGIGYGQLREANPALIYCALTGYGQTGPLAALAGHDLNIAGMSGLLQLHPGQVPAMPNMLMGDYAGAMMVVVGILSALVERERSGRGAFLDVSMLDSLISWTTTQMTVPFARAIDPRQGDAIEGWGGNPRYGIYRTRDGRYVTVSLLEKKFWDAFCRLQGREDLINPDETEADRLTSHGARGAAYRAFLEALFATRDRDDWVAGLQAHGIPVCPVLTPDEAYRSRHGHARGHFFNMAVARLGTEVPQIGFPFRMTLSDGSDAFAARREPPALGEARDEFVPATQRTQSHVDVS
ncbi:MAG: CoA transferase [Betaproteobacteria bacterium]|nr:CoA transferase [Betaproteobacteria bacterium]